MGSRRVFPLSVDTAASTNVNRSQPPPPKSPVHRSAGNGSIEIARPPTGGSVGYMGLDRLMVMRQVNAAAVPTTIQLGSGGDEVSAAVNHRQRMAAEHQRRLETALMEKEDYTGTPEGQERLQRQEERSRMREEELLVLRLVEMEKEAARILQREKELEEEKRVKEQYLAKIRAQREQQEKEAKEKEAARKAEIERKMKALKEAADAKARAEFAEKQHAIEEEARLAREKHQIEVENVQMQVEDVLGHAMQQEMIVERERQRQIAAEQDEWRLFQEREQEKQREAAQLRRAAMAQQYEQDKQRRIQIHKLQKERAAQQAERREMQNRQVLKQEEQHEEVKLENASASVSEDASNSTAQDEENQSAMPPTVIEDKLKDDNATSEDNSSSDSREVTDNSGGNTIKLAGNESLDETEKNVRSIGAFWFSGAKSFEPKLSVSKNEGETQTESKSSYDELQGITDYVEQESRVCAIPAEASEIVEVDEVTARADLVEANGDIPDDNKNTHYKKMEEEIVDLKSATDKHVSDTTMELIVNSQKLDEVRSLLSISAARQRGVTPFAQVLSVAKNSPAMHATLKSGDLLVEFGGIVSSTPKCLMEMAECVQKKVNNTIPVVLLRPVGATSDETFEEVRVSLCPRKWTGKGLLGCQLSPYKWSVGEEVAQNPSENEVSVASVVETSSNDDGASALVLYDIVPASIADQAGLLNGDILAGCDDLEVSINVENLSLIVGHIQGKQAVCTPIHLNINRWIEEHQCYRSLRVELSSSEDPGSLGFALTSFAEYYNYYSNTSTAASACQECYYTPLTTALHAAALSGHVNCLEALLNSLQNGDGGGYSASDYLDWRDEDGRTPLFYACYAGQLECVRYLLNITQSVSTEQQPFVSAGVDLYGDTVIHAATTNGNVAVIALLLESGCVKVDDRNHTRLTCAHVAPNVEILTFLGEQSDADLLATDAEERMPLAYACLRNDIESIQYLCKKHPDFVDYADIRGNTPLHVAAWLGLQQAAEVLITFLPSIALFITNEDGQNAAELARSNGMEDVAAFLDSVIAAADSNVS